MKRIITIILIFAVLLCVIPFSALVVSSQTLTDEGYYLISDMNDWKIDKDYKFQNYGSSSYRGVMLYGKDIKGDETFQIVYSVDGKTVSDNNSVYPEKDKCYNENGEVFQYGAFKGYVLYFFPNGSAYDDGDCVDGYLFVTLLEPPEDDLEDTIPVEGYYLLCDMNDWKIDKDYKFQNYGNSSYRGTMLYGKDIKGDETFQIVYSVDGKTVSDNNSVYPEKDKCYNENGEVFQYGAFKWYGFYFYPNGTTYGEGDSVDNHLYVMLLEPPEDDPDPIAYVIGDADGDGEISILDATYIQRSDVGFTLPTPIIEDAADVDGDGYVSIIDATLIQRYLVGIPTLFNIGGIYKLVRDV